MAPRAKTRDRIIEASLELFNAQGERAVTTNHIAQHLGISPGNLYYHFRNKQAIVAELFGAYERRVAEFLRLPEQRSLTVADKAAYLEALLEAMWRYRFLHRDLEHLLAADTQLAEGYRRFAQRCMAQAATLYQGFVEIGVLRMTPVQIEALVVNAWIVLTSWVSFLGTVRGDSGELDEAQLRRGIYQLLALETAFVTESARGEVDALLARLYVPLEAVLGAG